MAVKRGVPGAELPAAAAAAGQRRSAGRTSTRARGHAGALRRRDRQPGARRRRSGAPGRQGHRAGRLRVAARRAGDVHGPVGPARRRGRRRAVATRSWSRPRAGRGCGAGWSGSRPSGCSRRPSSTATSRASARATTWSCSTRRDDGAERYRFTFPRQRHDRHLCLADFFRPRRVRRGRRARLPAGHDGPADRRGHRRAVRRKDAYRDYLELHGLSVQLTEALAEYWHKRMRAELGFAGEDPDKHRGLLRPGATAARGTPSATPPAPTWRTAPRSSTCSSRSGSGSSCPRSSSCTPSSRPTRWSLHHPEAKYFNAK